MIEGRGRVHRDRAVEVTDVDDYLVSNPQFAECREEGHDFPRSRDVPLLEAYGDEAASHHKVLVCRGCKTKKRERFLITLRRGKVASFVQLETRGDYSEAVGYLAQGIRINRRYVKEFAIRQELETLYNSATKASARRQDRGPRQRPTENNQRKAAVA